MNKQIATDTVKKLQDMYDDDHAQPIFKWAAARQKDAWSTRIDRLAYLTDVPRHHVLGIIRELEALGCCKFVAGRHGRPSRIKWLTSVRAMGQAAAGAANALSEIDPTADEEDEADGSGITHSFQLRADEAVTFELPADLTKIEAERLATFIRSLPFGE